MHALEIETPRLRLRPLLERDDAFILELLNEPAFLANIGDKDVRDLSGARNYIEKGPQASYQQHGHGLLLVELQAGAVPVGICGLVKRDSLPHPDIGYAFLQRHWGRGYASEAGAACLAHGRERLNIDYVVGITAPGNLGSIRVLEKLGLQYDRTLALPGINGPSLYYVPAGRGEKPA
ncbi:GNAT family N-acetyltransferase [Chromobacterium subtsugae]|uniref:GNAT family N-acetyltransferase n=1 Tax=Chromobacterium subtsugae TaxID=251747 RepID=A0ABS7FC76_9NEIS|nr:MULTISPECIES: GNAT family N-acetyltransferase [Chromobacterium]KUM01799.1 GCN5 family acetyltransferase [Chromobacterium subtsugae]KZE86766.1 GCN5 family acetyltransferase [Chromobacterium sp. F49]MBW7568567.1 GNAT family N-acetyltransferase [Chromobacterium subtsugae]MBW8287602.1 GNAT family N-acetyltransferase [Chromobacterium subtsugae]WSE93553.1 GNAT family N-acetyltransferase [Chromobacterium subtsugae]